jgi:hypothetical protein
MYILDTDHISLLERADSLVTDWMVLLCLQTEQQERWCKATS